MSKKLKNRLIRIIISGILFVIFISVDLTIGLASFVSNKEFAWLLPFFLYLVVYFIIGYDVLWKAARNIAHGQIFDENFLMCIATIGAFGIKEFAEGVAVLLFYQVGEFFQDYAVRKSRKSISELMDIRPDYANLLLADGNIIIKDPNEICVGDILLIKPGEKIPLDSIVIEGSSSLDTKALTGESLPQEVKENDKIISGAININGTLRVKVLKPYEQSTVAKILELVENATNKKSKSENFISKFAKWYTPLVVLGAVLVALIPSLITGDYLTWITRSLNFLVISCPCALVISVPLSFFASIGGASKKGILIKGSTYIEQFNKANLFVFDKTGTLTKGNFKVEEVYNETSEDILMLASIAEVNSNHPIAKSIKEAYGKEVRNDYQINDIQGKGLEAKNGEETILVGNNKLMELYNVAYKKTSANGTIVHVAKNNHYVGYIIIKDEIKEDAKKLITYLNKNGSKTVMLTGDNEAIAHDVSAKLGLTEYHASLLPQDKVKFVDQLLETKQKGDVLCFVGDGINDAPVIMKSDIGIAMGGVGSDAAIEASDIVLMHDDLSSIISAKRICKKTIKIVNENIYFALTIKLLILVLSVIGYSNMWLAILADVGVSLLAILNSLRSSKI